MHKPSCLSVRTNYQWCQYAGNFTVKIHESVNTNEQLLKAQDDPERYKSEYETGQRLSITENEANSAVLHLNWYSRCGRHIPFSFYLHQLYLSFSLSDFRFSFLVPALLILVGASFTYYIVLISIAIVTKNNVNNNGNHDEDEDNNYTGRLNMRVGSHHLWLPIFGDLVHGICVLPTQWANK